MMRCIACKVQLQGKADTFGDIDQEMCWNCFSDHAYESFSWYGLAPHHHDMEITGSIVGSTVFDELPEPNENGEYEIDGYLFTPNPLEPHMGIWSPKK